MLNKIIFLIFIYATSQKSDVYYTKTISPDNVVKMFRALNVTLKGNVGLKVHTGEIGGAYFLRPDFLQKIYDYTNGTFIETNTAYTYADRHTTDGHRVVLRINGWTANNRRVVIMDENPKDDFILQIPKHKNISKNYVGGRLKEFDSCVVLSHFKGHNMGGFGGALKQLSIGFASQAGKAYIHTGGYTTDYKIKNQHRAKQSDFIEAMADAASSIIDYFKNIKKGEIVYIDVMSNISIKCDCGAGAPPPKVRDLGILASTDPVAIDRAAFDLIKKENTEGSKEWVEHSEARLGSYILKVAEYLGYGTQDYNLIDVDHKLNMREINEKSIWNKFIPHIIMTVVGISIFGVIVFKKM